MVNWIQQEGAQAVVFAVLNSRRIIHEMTLEAGRQEGEQTHALRAVVLNESWEEIAPLFDGLARHGVQTVKGYHHQENMIEDLDGGTFPQADVFLTEMRLPIYGTGEPISEASNAIAVVSELREHGMNLPVIMLSTFAFSQGDQAEIDDQNLRNAGIIVDRGSFTFGLSRTNDLAESIKSALIQ